MKSFGIRSTSSKVKNKERKQPVEHDDFQDSYDSTSEKSSASFCASPAKETQKLSKKTGDIETYKNKAKKKQVAKRAWEICLPVALQKRKFLILLVMAFYAALFCEGSDPATWRMLKHLQSNNKAIFEEAKTFLENHLKPFCQLIPRGSLDSNFATIFPYLDQQYVSYIDFSGTYEFNCQVHLFHSKTGTWIESYPTEFDPERRQLYFTALPDDGDTYKNIAIVENITGLFKVFGMFCFWCKKYFRGRGTQHRCPKTPSCFACRRPFLTSKTYVTKKTKKYFCDSSLHATVFQECSSCFMRIGSEHCKKHHRQRVCRWGIVCQKCNTYIFLVNL